MDYKIGEITKEMEAKIPEYRDKWIEIGLDTGPMNIGKVKELIPKIYVAFGYQPPKEVICLPGMGPIGLKRYIKSTPKYYDELIEKNGKDNVDSILSNFNYGSFDANWLGFYEFLLEVVGVKECENLIPMIELARYAGWYLTFQDYCFVADKPLELRYREAKDGRATNAPLFKEVNGEMKRVLFEDVILHADMAPVIRWRDDIGNVYALNGVDMPDWVVMTHPMELDGKKYIELKNQEQQREFVRKIGFEKLLKDLNAEVLDKEGEYELLKAKLGEAPLTFLKMLNPSIGVYHVEGVSNDCDTVDKALKFRTSDPAFGKLTFAKNGATWYQQGDIIIKPHGATKLKPRPTKLT